MPRIHLHPAAQAALRRAARRAYPREACGLLLGDRDEGQVHVLHAVPAANLALGHERDAFVLEPEAVPRAGALADVRGLEVVGVFHSHPEAPADASLRDLVGAPEGWLVLIVPVAAHFGRAEPGLPRAYLPEGAGTGRRLVPQDLRLLPQDLRLVRRSSARGRLPPLTAPGGGETG